MFKPETLLEKLLFTTVRIEAILSNKSTSIGTSFIFDYINEDKHYLFLVTNKHVIKDSVVGSLTLNLKEGDAPLLGQTHSISITNFERAWIQHYREDIDVAIMPFALVLKELSYEGMDVYFQAIPQRLIPSDQQLSEDIDAIEDIIFIGYPSDIYDKKNLLPVVRKGINATPISIDFEDNPAFLIDASIFPGSSGSPVFLCNTGSYSKKGKGLHLGNRVFFLGIISSVYIKKDFNTIQLIDVPTGKIPVIETAQMLDLGVVYKSRVIEELVKDYLRKRDEIL